MSQDAPEGGVIPVPGRSPVALQVVRVALVVERGRRGRIVWRISPPRRTGRKRAIFYSVGGISTYYARGEDTVAFLKRLRRRFPGLLTILWDRVASFLRHAKVPIRLRGKLKQRGTLPDFADCTQRDRSG